MSISVLLAIVFSVAGLGLIITGISKKKKVIMMSGIAIICLVFVVGFFTGNLFDFMNGVVDGIMS